MIGLLLGGLTIISSDVKAQEVINLDATIHASPSSPRVVNLKAGTYEVTPIGVDDGGAFNAWNDTGLTSGCDQDGTGCDRGWRNDYQISAPPLELILGDGMRYMTDIQALENAQGTQFTLDADTTVAFSLPEEPASPDDNLGGMSLRIVNLRVKGSVQGLSATMATCENRTTEQVIMIPLDGMTSWDCLAAGLTVNEGDIVFTGIEGPVTGEPPLEVLGIFSESAEPSLIPEVDSFIGTFSGEGAVFNPEDFVEDTEDVIEGLISLRSTLTVDADQRQFAGWFVSWGIEEEAGDNTVVRDMSTFQDGRLIFWVKSPINLEVGIRSGNIDAGRERSKILLSDVEGFAPDNIWHQLCVPIPTLVALDSRTDLSRIKVFFVIASNTASGGTGGMPATFLVDDVRWESIGCP
ncbi:hypothetical protein [Candidatus Entotheonella palauensis]|uniref:hypothetical protein n=1 Tax=Candidatus Entotheonella palauensis TaxID=93172 RepID=UPI0015C4A6D8|nr:hypothetical protein [Candidatus Entotheonella palauensis]